MKILLADDTLPIRMTLTHLFKQWDYDYVEAENGNQAWDLLQNDPGIGIAILDWQMDGLTGIEICERLAKSPPHGRHIYTIILTVRDGRENMIKALEHGAHDFLTKPVDPEELHCRLQAAQRLVAAETRADKYLNELQRIKTTQLQSRDQLKTPEIFDQIITSSSAMYRLFRYIENIAPNNETVLILGETGTGKELIAHAIHNASGRTGPFTALNVAAYREPSMLYSMLFGHRKGAYTGADEQHEGFAQKAAGGTLFLDEIGDMPPESQAALLRVIQERQFCPLGSNEMVPLEARVVAATNCDISDESRFRSDLYFRLKAHSVQLPPLRQRKEDIQLLLAHFVNHATERLGVNRPQVLPETAPFLALYDFPGNIRELELMIYNTMASGSAEISPESFRQQFSGEGEESGHDDSLVTLRGDHFPTLHEIQQYLVDEALRRTGGNQSQAAKLLGISAPALSGRLKRRSSS